LRRAVQQQQRRTLPSHRAVDGGTGHLHGQRLEAWEKLECGTAGGSDLDLAPDRPRQGRRRHNGADLSKHVTSRDAIVGPLA
jgi:hypothetical protein